MAMMSLSDLGTAAAVASAVAAAGALWVGCWTLHLQQRTRDAATLFQIGGEIRQVESRLLAAAISPESFKVELNHYLNALEMFAACVNRNLFGKTTLQFAADRLVTDLSSFLGEEQVVQHIQTAVTSDQTFRELSLFYRRNRAAVDAATARQAARRAA